MKRIAVFASGSGSNARRIMEHFSEKQTARVVLVFSNRKAAGVLNIADEFGVPTETLSKKEFQETDRILDILKSYQVDFIALAGFLLKIPENLLKEYPDKIVNIHPSLLPKFGGKGMYGHHVHEAVVAAGEKESGMTIHWLNAAYDEGEHIAQYRCAVLPEDDAGALAKRVLQLEHKYYAETIDNLLKQDGT